MPPKEHLDELNFVLIELRDIDVKMKDEDLAMILLAFLPLSYENYVSSLSVGKDSITLERSQIQSLFSWASTKGVWEWWWSLYI